MPITLSLVSRSFKKRADKIKIMIGVSVVMIPLLIGVESSSPLKNISILMHIPKRAATKRRLKSFLETCSFGKKGLTIQNKMDAPKTRNIIKPKAPI